MSPGCVVLLLHPEVSRAFLCWLLFSWSRQCRGLIKTDWIIEAWSSYLPSHIAAALAKWSPRLSLSLSLSVSLSLSPSVCLPPFSLCVCGIGYWLETRFTFVARLATYDNILIIANCCTALFSTHCALQLSPTLFKWEKKITSPEISEKEVLV